MLLSIIIPIYKVEKYIRSTLKSIYDQGVEEQKYEVICVNDGTPDTSMQIVQEFANSHKNLHIINQENQGLSCARNSGLKIATGDYIWFVDSDDTLEADSISNVIKYVQSDSKTEIWGFNMVRVQENDNKEDVEHVILKRKNFGLYNISLRKESLIHKSQIAPVQRFVFKYSFLKSEDLTFFPQIYHEDVEFMSRAIFLAKQIKFINYAPYRYLVRTSGSITSSFKMKSVTDKMIIISQLNYSKQRYARNIFDKAYFNDFALYLVRSILKSYRFHKNELNNFIKLNRKELRAILFKGLLANLYLLDIKKCIASIILLIKL